MRNKCFASLTMTAVLAVSMMGCSSAKDNTETSVAAPQTTVAEDTTTASEKATEKATDKATTQEETTKQPETTEEITETQTPDWMKEGDYFGDYAITDDLHVCLQKVDDGYYIGYAAYDLSSGKRVGSLYAPGHVDWFYDRELHTEDYNDDGYNDIGMPVDDGFELHYLYEPEQTWPEWEEGCFSLNDQNDVYYMVDLTTYPYEQKAHPEMTERQKQFYDEMLQKIENFEYFSYDEETYPGETNEAMIAWGYLKDDHPRINLYFELKEIDEEDGTFISYDSCYCTRWDTMPSYDIEVIRAGLQSFDATVDEILSGLKYNMSAYQKYEYLAKVISQRTNYDYDRLAGSPETMWGGIMGGFSICRGYSEAMMYLCQKANLYCAYVDGTSREEGHVWNLVKTTEGTYHVDVTWCDCNSPEDTETPQWSQYFLVNQEKITVDHNITDGTVATGL